MLCNVLHNAGRLKYFASELLLKKEVQLLRINLSCYCGPGSCQGRSEMTPGDMVKVSRYSYLPTSELLIFENNSSSSSCDSFSMGGWLSSSLFAYFTGSKFKQICAYITLDGSQPGNPCSSYVCMFV